MPTFDGGHYFLTAVVPIRTAPVKDGLAVTSPVHALRKRLSLMPTAAETPARGGGQSPFARNKRNHFARFVIIDDVAYTGRTGRNALWGRVRGDDLAVAQPQDHLTCPFLVFVVDFDAKSGADAERDSYLVELWNTMGQDLREIFIFCEGFKSKVTDAASFAAYIASCQLETTMSFNDYYAETPVLPAWSGKIFLWAGIASLLVLGLGLFGLFMPLVIVGVVALVAVILAAYASIMAAGGKPFPSAPDSDLPSVLKALHLQRTFTGFAIDSQMQAAGTDAASAQRLYDDFAAFVAANKPNDIGAPTQAPGVIEI